MIPPGLTDITVEPQTQEQGIEAQAAVSRRDFRRFQELQGSVVFHFGEKRVRLRASKAGMHMFMMDMQALLQEPRPEVFESLPGGSGLGFNPTLTVRLPQKQRRTAWDFLMASPLDDD